MHDTDYITGRGKVEDSVKPAKKKASCLSSGVSEVTDESGHPHSKCRCQDISSKTESRVKKALSPLVPGSWLGITHQKVPLLFDPSESQSNLVV